MSLTLTVSRAVRDRFPGLGLGLVQWCSEEGRPIPAAIEAERAGVLEHLIASGLDTATLSSHPHIADWREAYRAFGTKPSSHRPTHEALARRLLQDRRWPPPINPLVDAYLCNQMAFLLPHGGYDLRALGSSLALDFSPGGEPFELLGGGHEETYAGEVVYRDQVRVLTRRWNWRDCHATRITETSVDVLLVIECVRGNEGTLPEATAELAALLRRCWTGGTARWTVTDGVEPIGIPSADWS